MALPLPSFSISKRKLLSITLAVLVLFVAAALLYQKISRSGRPAFLRPSTYDAVLDSRLLPSPLQWAPGFDSARDYIQLSGTPPANAVSMVVIDPQNALLCDYGNIYHLAFDTGALRRIRPKNFDGHWQPTGLFYHQQRQTLFVANWKGKNCLEFDLGPDFSMHLRRTISLPSFVGPEGIVVNSDASLIAIADHDAGYVHLLAGDNKLLWSRPVRRTHGISFEPGEKTILATSLSTRQIIRFDLEGNTIDVHGRAGSWGEDGYLYPTDLALSAQGEMAVLDAHTGKITLLRPNLTADKSIGGNGQGPLLFNTPYGFCWKEPGRLIVVDMYKRRFVEIDVATNTVQRIWSYRTHQKDILKAWPFLKELAQAPTEQELLLDSVVAGIQGNPPVLGLEDQLPKNRRTGFSMPLPYLEGETTAWFGFYKRLRDANGRSALLRDRLHLYAYANYFRYIKARRLKVDDTEVTLLGGGQAEEILIIKDGIAVPLRVGRNFWLWDNYLVNDRYALPQQLLGRVGLKRIKQLRLALEQEGTVPLTALHTNLFPELSPEEFRARLKATCVSPESKVMLADLEQAKDLTDARAAARIFIEAVAKSRAFSLWEIFLAHSVLPKVTSSP